jgi:hypothetical protein
LQELIAINVSIVFTKNVNRELEAEANAIKNLLGGASQITTVGGVQLMVSLKKDILIEMQGTKAVVQLENSLTRLPRLAEVAHGFLRLANSKALPILAVGFNFISKVKPEDVDFDDLGKHFSEKFIRPEFGNLNNIQSVSARVTNMVFPWGDCEVYLSCGVDEVTPSYYAVVTNFHFGAEVPRFVTDADKLPLQREIERRKDEYSETFVPYWSRLE